MRLKTLHWILTIIAILLVFYILYKLKYKRCIQIVMNEIPIIEGNTSAADAEVAALVTKYNEFSNVSSITDKFTNMPLHEYCFKSSYNTARSGDYVSSKMIEAVLKRGCRFLDFEVFYIKDGNLFIPKVAVSSDPNFVILDTLNSISLDEALSTVATNAFSGTSPNSSDPIFVNLRIKSRDSNIYRAVAKSIDANLKQVAYDADINKSTNLRDVMRKAVIVFDKTMQPDYKQYAKCTDTATGCFDLTNYINLESGSEYLNKYHYTDLLNHANTPPLLKDDNIRTTTTHMKMAVPDIIGNDINPAFKEFVIKHGCQNVFYQFHIVDQNLKNYEEFFSDKLAGTVPLSVVLPHFAGQ